MFNNKNLMKRTFFFLFYCLNFTLIGFAQDFQWVRQIKGITYDYNDFANGLAVDSNENTYTIGSTDSLLFDLNPTEAGKEIIDNTIPNTSFKGTYLIKTDVNGNYIWGLTFALNKGPYKGYDEGIDVKIGTDGNIYALLSLEEVNIALNVTNSYIKIIKISPDGTILSTITIPKNYGSNNNINVYSFDLDNQNNIFLTGYFTGNIAFDINNPSLNLNSNGLDIYLLKINNDSTINWAKQFNINDISSSAVMVRPDGNVNLMVNSGNDYSLFNLDNTNNSIIWQKKFINQRQTKFHLSQSGIIILGEKNYYDTIDVDPSSGISNISGNNTNFIIFLNLNGDFIDVKQFNKPTNGDIILTAVSSDSSGNYYFGGIFKDTIDLDPSNNIFNLTSYYGEAFFLKLDNNRNFDTAFKLGDETPKLSPYNNCYLFEIKEIKTVKNNNYLVGDFMWTCDFDPSTTTQYTLGTVNQGTINRDGFILKLGPCNSSKVVGEIDQTFCSVSNPTISSLSINSNSILWYDSINSTIPLSISTPLLDNKKYYATRKTGNCPESSERLEITVHIALSPQAPVPVSAMFCQNDNSKLSDINILGQNLKWYANLTDLSNIPTSTILQNGTTYYVTQTINGCESNRTPIPVTINTTLNPSATSPQTLCIQQNATLNNITITGQNIKWYDGLINGNLLLNATFLQNATTYYASQTVNGCESDRIAVSVNITNTPAPTGNTNQTFCWSQNPTLSTIAISGSSVRWYDANGVLLSNATALQDGKTYYATQTVNGCESITKLAIKVLITSTLPANNYNESFCDDLNDGVEKINLSNYNWNLISNSSGYTFSYYSNYAAAENQLATNQITDFSNYTLALGDNKIYVRINSNTPCYAVAELKLTLLSKPKIAIPDLMPICENNTVTIDAGSFGSYIWSTAATSRSIIVSNPGNYWVTVTNNYNTISCSSTKNFEVRKSTVATITSIDTQDWTDNQNTITVYTTGAGDFEYSIDGIHFQDEPQFTNLISGQYTVYVKDKNGCGTVTNEVYLLMYPKFFTPNEDGFNDTWKIKFSDTEIGLTVKIFDRYGKFIKELTNDNSWDGNFNKQQLPSADYWFVVIRSNGKEYKGHFSLKR